MRLELTENQREMVGAVRRLANEKFKKRVSKWQHGAFPYENLKDLAEIGVLGMGIPEEFGGLGLPVLDCALVLEEIAKVCYVTSMSLMSLVGVQIRVISTYAPQHLQQEILPGVVKGDVTLAVGMTEPHAGTDVGNLKTNAVIKGSSVIVMGTKTLISKVDEADWFVIFTRVNGTPGRDGIGCVLINRNTPGFEVTAHYQTMGGEKLGEIQFRDCELPLENLILREGGFKKLLSAFNTQRCLNPAICLGLAEGAFGEAVRYARDRVAFGKRIGSLQGIRWKLAEMLRDIEVGRSMLYRAAASADPFPDAYLAGIAKMYCNEMAIRVTSEAIQIHGGYGFLDEFPVSRFYRAARYGSLGGGTTETLKELVGKRVYDAFPEDGFLGLGLM